MASTPRILSLLLLLLTSCIRTSQRVPVTQLMSHCSLYENEGPINVEFPIFSKALADFEKSEAYREILVIKISPGKNKSICRRFIQNDSRFLLVTITEQNAAVVTTQIEQDSTLSNLLSGLVNGHHSVISSSIVGHIPMTVIMIKEYGVTKCSLSFETINCLAIGDMKKIRVLHEVSQHVFAI